MLSTLVPMSGELKLAEQQCKPNPKGASALSPNVAAERLTTLQVQFEHDEDRTGWQISNANNRLSSTFLFKNFRGALAFINRVGAMAEEQNHHPDIELSWGRVSIVVWSHDVDGLSDNDFIFAARAQSLVTIT